MTTTPTDLRELADFPDYGCTPDGAVWSFKSGIWRRLALTTNGLGYLKVKVIGRSGGVVTRKAHVLVAMAFLGDRPDEMDINHKDGNKTNNSIANLEYVTRSENVLHSIHVLNNKCGARVSEEEIQRRKRVAKCHLRRKLAAALWGRDGRMSLTRPALASMKLSEDIIREIRAHAAKRTMTRRAMATHYQVSRPTIDRIIARRKWAHVP